MKIDNQTDWDGRHIRRLCRTVIDHTDGKVRGRRIKIYTSRSAGKDRSWEVAIDATPDDSNVAATVRSMYRGYAYYNRLKIGMGVPKPERKVDGEWYRHDFDSTLFARVLEHEIAHNRGLRHGEMVDSLRYCSQDIDYDLPDVEAKPSYEYRVD